MLAFLNEQIDKIVLLLAVGAFVFAALWLTHYGLDPKWIDKAWEAVFILIGALIREVSGPVSALIKSITNGGTNGTEKK